MRSRCERRVRQPGRGHQRQLQGSRTGPSKQSPSRRGHGSREPSPWHKSRSDCIPRPGARERPLESAGRQRGSRRDPAGGTAIRARHLHPPDTIDEVSIWISFSCLLTLHGAEGGGENRSKSSPRPWSDDPWGAYLRARSIMMALVLGRVRARPLVGHDGRATGGQVEMREERRSWGWSRKIKPPGLQVVRVGLLSRIRKAV